MSELRIHPEAEQLEAYVEGALEDGQKVVLESHLVMCERCRAEVEEWRALFTALATLPVIEPSADFADRVLAGVRVTQSPARAKAALRWVPRTTRGWSVVAACMALPMIGLASLTAWLLTQPWATVLSLQGAAVYGWTALNAGVSYLAQEAQAVVLRTAVASAILDALREFMATAGARGVGLAAAGLAFAAMLSAWVLYDNLIRNSSRETRYAPYTI